METEPQDLTGHLTGLVTHRTRLALSHYYPRHTINFRPARVREEDITPQ